MYFKGMYVSRGRITIYNDAIIILFTWYVCIFKNTLLNIVGCKRSTISIKILIYFRAFSQKTTEIYISVLLYCIKFIHLYT